MLFYTTPLGPPVGDPAAMYAPPLRYKGEALAALDKLSRAHTHRRTLDSTPNSSVLSNTAHSGRRVLRSGGTNHSKPAVFIVFLREIELVAS